MTDEKIIELFWYKNEQAISETRTKYGKYCYTIAYNILRDREDSLECENDTYLGVWNAIPPARPAYFPAFIGKIARNLSLKRLRAGQARKRAGEALSFDELSDCIPDGESIERELETQKLAGIIDSFLSSLDECEQRIFVCRYFFSDSIRDISLYFGFSQSKVKMILFRARQKLRAHLEREGVFV